MKVFCDDFIPKFNKEIVKRGKKKYLKSYISFDSETSWNHDEENPVGWIFQWCFRIEDCVVIGRKPSQFIDCLKRILVYINDCDCNIIIFIHNLSYDLQYLKNFLISAFGEYKILATSPHKFITFTIDKLEFRCTYRLSNRSLSKWAKDLGVNTQKLVDTVNYNDIHTQQEKLDDIWWEYQIADVNCLHECVEKQLSIYNDTLATIPLTSTGYVRRECRRNYRKNPKEKKKFLNTKTKADVYIMLDKAFMGGISHGNRNYIEETVKANIRHRDFVSHYPSQQRVRKFPTGKFNLYTNNANITDVKKCVKDGYCCIIEIMIRDVVLKDNKITMPYLSESKVLQGKCGIVKCLKDNGRILKATGTFVLYLTELDLDIILRQYKIGCYNITKMYVSKAGYLPEFLLKTIDEFFIDKTKYRKLSENENNLEKKIDYIISLIKAKNGLNGIYGMTAQRPIRDEIEMDVFGNFIINKPYSLENIQEKLDEYYSNNNSFMRFAFGVWCTAWARWELMRYCEIIGYENILYCDTDSAFYISTHEIEKRIEEENKRCLNNSETIGAFIEYEGEKVYYDQFRDENENITEFRFLHSKCYAYIENDTLHVTIAGVPSSTYDYESGKRITREEELGDISELKDGKIFTINGGTKSCYIESEISEYMNQEIASSCIITNTTKTLKNFENQTLTMGKWEVLEDV